MATEVGKIYLSAVLESGALTKGLAAMASTVKAIGSGLNTTLGNAMSAATSRIGSAVSAAASNLPASFQAAGSMTVRAVQGIAGGISSAMQGIRNVVGNVAGAVQSTLNKAFESAKTAASNNLASIASSLKQLGTITGTVLTASLTALGVSGLKGAAGIEQTRIGIEAMSGSAEVARKVLNQITQYAALTPFRFPELATTVKQLTAYGFSAEDAVGQTKMLGNVAAALNLRMEDLAYVYGTLRAQGRAYAIDIRQFALRGIPIYEYLGKVLNVDTEAVKDLVSEGKVGFKEVEKAFQLMTGEGGKFHDMTLRQSKSLSGLYSTVADYFQLTMAQVIGITQEGEVRSGSVFDKLRNGLASMVTYLTANQNSIAASADRIFSSFLKYLPYIAAFIGAILGMGVLAWLGGIVMKFAQVLLFMFNALRVVTLFILSNPIVLTLVAIGAVLAYLIDKFVGWGSAMDWAKRSAASLWDGLKALGGGIMNVVKPAIDWLGKAIYSIGQSFINWYRDSGRIGGIFQSIAQSMRVLDPAWQQLKKTADIVFQPIKDMVSGLADSFGKAGDKGSILKDVLVGILFIFNPWLGALALIIAHWKTFGPIINTVATALLSIVNTVLPPVISAIKFLVNLLVQVGTVVGALVMPMLKNLWNNLVTLYNILAPVLIPILKVLGIILGVVIVGAISLLIIAFGAIVTVVTFVVTAVVQLITWFVQIIQALFSALGAFISGVWDAIKWIVVTAVEIMVAIVVGIFNVLKAIVMAIFDAIKWYIQQWVNSVKAIWNGLGWLVDKIGGILGSIKNFFVNVFNSIINFIKGLAGTFYDAGKGLIDAIVNGIKKVASAPIDAVKGILGKVRNLLPFSDAKTGPLSNLTASGKALPTTFAQGIMKGAPAIANALQTALNVLPSYAPAGGPNAAYGALGANGGVAGQNITLNIEPKTLNNSEIDMLIDRTKTDIARGLRGNR